MSDLLRRAIKIYGTELTSVLEKHGTNIDGAALLAAICFAETKLDPEAKETVDLACQRDGELYDRLKETVPRYTERMGRRYGPMQIIAWQAQILDESISAPENLCDTDTNIRCAVCLITERCLSEGKNTVGEIADRYRRLNYLHYKRRPAGYIKKVIAAYNGIAKEWLYE